MADEPRLSVGQKTIVALFSLGWMAGIFTAMTAWTLPQGGYFLSSLYVILIISTIGMVYTGYWNQGVRLYVGDDTPAENEEEVTDADIDTSTSAAMKETLLGQLRAAPSALSMVGSVLLGLIFLFGTTDFQFTPEWVAVVIFKAIGVLFVAAPAILMYQDITSENED